MAAKRTKEEREHDIQIEAEMKIKGHSYRAIANYINKTFDRSISHITIRSDVNQYIKQWKADHDKEFDDRLNVELRKLELREKLLWEAWERSCESIVIKAVKKKGSFKKVNDIQTEEKTYHGKGDPRYMDQLDKLSEKRCKLLGLYAPDKTELSFEKLSDSQLSDVISKIIGDEKD